MKGAMIAHNSKFIVSEYTSINQIAIYDTHFSIIKTISTGAFLATTLDACNSLVCASINDHCGIFDINQDDKLELVQTDLNNGPQLCAKFSPNGHTIAAGCTDSNIYIITNHKVMLTIKFHSKPVIVIEYINDSHLISIGEDGIMTVCELLRGVCLSVYNMKDVDIIPLNQCIVAQTKICLLYTSPSPRDS